MLKTAAMVKALSPHNVHKAATAVAAVPTTGTEGDWNAYWTLVTGMIIVLFLLYIAGNGQLTAWLQLFTYATPATPSPAGASAASGPLSTLDNLMPASLKNVATGLNNLVTGPPIVNLPALTSGAAAAVAGATSLGLGN